MGVVNVTPDSFSDGGAFLDPDAAVKHGLRLAFEGADLLDVGGESTRPGAEPVSEREELNRVLPVIEGIRASNPDVRISIDTSKTAVAAAALDAGADYVNDVTALRGDPELTTLGRPVVLGTSRKSFLGKITGREVAERMPATLATLVMAYERGAEVFRVHDVAPARDALCVAAATLARPWPPTTRRT